MPRSPTAPDNKTKTASRPLMAANRRLSWMDEVGSTVPRRPSHSGAAVPFMPSTIFSASTTLSNASTSRSQSFSTIQTPDDLANRIEASKWFSINEEAVSDEPDSPKVMPMGANSRRLSTPLVSLGLNPNPWNNTWSPSPLNLNDVPSYSEGPVSTYHVKQTSPPSTTSLFHTDNLVTALPARLNPSATFSPTEMSLNMDFKSPRTEPFAGWQGGPASSCAASEESVVPRSAGFYSPVDRPRYNLITSSSYYAVVEFKRFRTEVYQYHTSWGMDTKEGLMVVVEADRGVDLGKVIFIAATPSEARDYKKQMNKTHYKALLSLSVTSQPPRDESDIAFNQYYDFNMASAHVGGFAAGNGALPPRSIKRIATESEIAQLSRKQAFEDKARRMAIITAKKHGMDAQSMEILDAEFQYDFNKLTVYFLSPHYLHFNALVADLFKLFKTRIWMSALNPAACAPGFHAVMQSAAAVVDIHYDKLLENQWLDANPQLRPAPKHYHMPQRNLYPSPMAGGGYGSALTYGM